MENSQIVRLLQNLEEYSFERLVADLWERRGWDTEVTPKSNDKGVDVIAVKEDPYPEKEIIQAKRYGPTNKVGRPEIQQYTALLRDADRVVVVCTSEFTTGALSIANEFNIKCVNGKMISEMIWDNDSIDLVKMYSDSESLKPDEARENIPTEENIGETKADNPLTEQGDGLVVEMLGREYIDLTQNSDPESEFPGETKYDEDYVLPWESDEGSNTESESISKGESIDPVLVLAVEVTNTGIDPFDLNQLKYLKLIDGDGSEFTPLDLEDDRGVPNGRCVLPGSSTSCVVGFDFPKNSEIAEIVHKYEIQFNLDERDYSEFPALPEEFGKISID